MYVYNYKHNIEPLGKHGVLSCSHVHVVINEIGKFMCIISPNSTLTTLYYFIDNKIHVYSITHSLLYESSRILLFIWPEITK